MMKRMFLLVLVMAALSGCSTLKTPEIKGVVVDAETGKPIADARIYAEWRRIYSGPGGPSAGGIVKELRLTTDKDGRFSIPSRLVINVVPYPFGQGGYFFLILYNHGYIYKQYSADMQGQVQEIFKDSFSDKNIIIKLNKIKTPKDWKWNYDEICRIELDNKPKLETNSDYNREEKIWFVNNFGNIKYKTFYEQSMLIDKYTDIGDYQSAINKWNEYLKDNPEDEKYIKQRLHELSLKLKSK